MGFHTGAAAGSSLAQTLRITGKASGFALGNATSIVFSNAPGSSNRRQAAARRQAELGDAHGRRGEFSKAVPLFAFAVECQPNNADYRYKLGCALWCANRTEGVELHLLESARLQPTNPAVHEALALWYLRNDRIDAALKHSAAATNLAPHDLAFVVTHADVLVAAGQTSAAWNLIAPLVETGAGGPWLARMFARLAPRVGHETQAAEYIESSLNPPASAPALSPDDRARMHYAAAGLLDKMGRYDQAFSHATKAKQVVVVPFDAADHSRGVSGRIRYYTKKRLASLARATNASRRPVFIVGMPRSGTSLLEQILASHPAVFGAGELTRLSDIAQNANSSQWAQGGVFPEFFDSMSLSQADELAGEYLLTIDALNPSATYVTDKMPMNYLFLGMASLLLPQCRVIHCVRDARDTCLSCYLTDFGDRQPFTSSLADLASVYRDYQRLMEHWKKVLPLPILDVRYEDLVSDQEGQTRRMLQFLDLPFDGRCLQFHQTARSVATASREQVRQPIYSTSIGRWKHYREHIQDLMGL